MIATDPVKPEVVAMLEEHRDWLNQRFRFHAAQGIRIEPQTWLQHVRHRLIPILATVQATFPERAKLALMELYEVSLELFSSGHLGTERQSDALSQLWDNVLPLWGKCIARDPRRVVGSCSNACLHLAQVAPSVLPAWLQVMARLGAKAESPDQILDLGKAAAWTSGMAQYRQTALSLAKQLPIALVRQLIEVPSSHTDEQAKQYLEQLENDPWCKVEPASTSTTSTSTIENVAVCGAFRGFGGTFMAPPTAYSVDGSLIVTDRNQVWRLHADRFGASFQRVDLEASSLRTSRARLGPKIDAEGRIEWLTSQWHRPDLANATSYAFDGITMAVTIPTSFHVYLLAKPTTLGRGS